MYCKTSGVCDSSLAHIGKGQLRLSPRVVLLLATGPILVSSSQDRNAGSGADGRHRENHDAEWRHLWHIHGYRDGHPMLIRAMGAHINSLPSVSAHVL